jgi:hypothetical protein
MKIFVSSSSSKQPLHIWYETSLEHQNCQKEQFSNINLQ